MTMQLLLRPFSDDDDVTESDSILLEQCWEIPINVQDSGILPSCVFDNRCRLWLCLKQRNFGTYGALCVLVIRKVQFGAESYGQLTSRMAYLLYNPKFRRVSIVDAIPTFEQSQILVTKQNTGNEISRNMSYRWKTSRLPYACVSTVLVNEMKAVLIQTGNSPRGRKIQKRPSPWSS